MFGRHKRHARSSSLLSACHSFSPFLITPWFLIHIPGRKSLKWRSCCHLSRRPVGFIHPFFTPQTCSPSWWNYESRFIGWLLRHILYYCNRCNVSVFLAQRGIFQAFSFSIPLLRMFTPDSTPTPCPLLLPLSSVSTPFSFYLLHVIMAPLFSVCLRRGLHRDKREEEEWQRCLKQMITPKIYSEMMLNDYIKPTFYLTVYIHIHVFITPQWIWWIKN